MPAAEADEDGLWGALDCECMLVRIDWFGGERALPSTGPRSQLPVLAEARAERLSRLGAGMERALEGDFVCSALLDMGGGSVSAVEMNVGKGSGGLTGSTRTRNAGLLRS